MPYSNCCPPLANFHFQDLDDALHVKEVDKGPLHCNTTTTCSGRNSMYGADVYEVGVHIADVSYFVKAGTALDEVASNRATSVYLVQRVSHNLCV